MALEQLNRLGELDTEFQALKERLGYGGPTGSIQMAVDELFEAALAGSNQPGTEDAENTVWNDVELSALIKGLTSMMELCEVLLKESGA